MNRQNKTSKHQIILKTTIAPQKRAYRTLGNLQSGSSSVVKLNGVDINEKNAKI